MDIGQKKGSKVVSRIKGKERVPQTNKNLSKQIWKHLRTNKDATHQLQIYPMMNSFDKPVIDEWHRSTIQANMETFGYLSTIKSIKLY